MPHVMRAVQAPMRLNMFPSSQDGMYAKGATQGVPLAAHVARLTVPQGHPGGALLLLRRLSSTSQCRAAR